MNSRDPSNTLDRLWDDVPVGTPPIDDLVRGGAAMRRRHRLRTIGGSAALTLAVVVGSAVAANTVFDGASPRPSDPPPATDVPIAPQGKRLVGMGRVVVAVPAEWGTNQLDVCGSPEVATVWFEDANHPRDCFTPPHRTAAVRFSPLDSTGGQEAAKFAKRMRIVDGVEVLRELAACPDVGFCVGDFVVRYVVVPSEGVAFTVSGPMRAQKVIDGIADSVQVLPADYTTVPFVEGDNPVAWNTAIAEAGLVPDGRLPVCGPHDVCASTPRVRPSPGPGEVVAVGSTVTLFGTSVDLPTSQWEPGAGGDAAALEGRLVIDEKGCVALGAPDAGLEGYGSRGEPPTYVVWPQGYKATLDGQLRILDAEGHLVGQHLDLVQLGGGFGPASAFPHPCLPGGEDEVFVIQSAVTVVD